MNIRSSQAAAIEEDSIYEHHYVGVGLAYACFYIAYLRIRFNSEFIYAHSVKDIANRAFVLGIVSENCLGDLSGG